MIGTTLCHYRIVRALGRGGMGEVYVAEDTRLHREVALKVLPREMASNPELLKRFEREAQAVAALNHPNVVTIYSVEEDGPYQFITMELVEGKTLTNLIPEQGMSLRELLRLAVPLSDAISAAHQRGIVHRDLKPANIMVAADGRLKVLDFGLAKLRRDHSGSPDSATLTTAQLTAQHAILGTPSYMSPEQAEGRPVDHRTDIFSSGVILYEMATGKRPFQGDSVVTILSSILKDTPQPVLEVNPGLPRELDRIVMRCLAKDPEDRYQSARELCHDLEAIPQDAEIPSGSLKVLARILGQKVRHNRRWFAAALALVLVAAGGYGLYHLLGGSVAALQVERIVPVTSTPGAEQFPSISPDGQTIVYSGEDSGRRHIYMQEVDGQKAFPITSDPEFDDDQPAYSPDGNQIAFRTSRAGGGIYRMRRTGEQQTKLTSFGFNPSWSPDSSRIVFATENVQLTPLNWEGQSELWIVDVATEKTQLLIKGDAVQPVWSPNDLRIAYVGRTMNASETTKIRQMHIMTIRTDGRDPVALTSGEGNDWSPAWSRDGKYLYFGSDRGGSMNLWRVPVDENSGKPRGEPQPITTPAPFLAHPSISRDGKRIVYSAVLETQHVQKIGFDPVKEETTGLPVDITRGSRLYSSCDITPDGQMLVCYSRSQPEGELWVMRSDGSGSNRITTGFLDRVPRWSPLGDWIAFFSNRSKVLRIFKMRPDGSEIQQLTYIHGSIATWSPNGRRMAFSSVDSAETYEFDPNLPWAEQTPVLLSHYQGSLRALIATSWSSDGDKLAFQSGFSDRGQNANLGIATYSFTTHQYQELTHYGEWPVWLPDSRRLLILNNGREYIVIDSQDKEKEGHKIYSIDRGSISPPRITRDGREIYFSLRLTEADIWRIDLR